MSFTELMLSLVMIVIACLPPADANTTMIDMAVTTPRQLDAILQNVSNEAAGSTDGYTVVIKPNGALETSVITYTNRPDQAQGPVVDNQNLRTPIVAPSGDRTFALVVAHDGSVTIIDPYTTWAAAAAGSTPCTSLALTFGAGTETNTANLDCTSASVTAN